MASSPGLRAPLSPLRSTAGAFDLASIIVGAVVVAVLAAGVLAAVFGVIPWSQDEQSKQDLSAVRTAEGTAFSTDGGFKDGEGLATLSYLPRAAGLDVGASADGKCYLAVRKSATGKIFYSSHLENEPRIMTPSTATGCLTPGDVQDAVDEIGGWDPSVYEPIGDGEGTPADPGAGVVTDTAEGGDSPVELTAMTIIDRVVHIQLSNTSTEPQTAAYAADVTCANTTTGAVTVETITGTFDLNGKIVSGVNVDACAAGSSPVAVTARAPYETYDALRILVPVRNQVTWRTHYVYYQATPVVRGTVASGEFCIDDKDFGAADGNPIILNSCNGSDAQRWQWDGSGSIKQAALLNKCLSVPDPASVAAQSLVLGTCSGSAGQGFTMAPHSDGKVQIVQNSSGLCIDIQGGAQVAGARLITAPCNGALSQSWKLPAGAEYLVPGTVPNAAVPPSEGGPQLAPPAPATPTSVMLAGYSGSGVHLSWAPVSGATGYFLEVTGTSSTYAADRKQTVTAVAMSATITGGGASTGGIMIPAGTDGQITVKALNGATASPASAPVSFSTPSNSVIAVTAAQGGTDFNFAKAAMSPTSNGTTADLLSTPRGTALASANGRFFAVFQADNNFVIYDKSTNRATYSSNTYQTSVRRLTFQPDANLVAYTATNSAVKSTGTNGISKPAILIMQNDGNLVIYDAAGAARWASMSSGTFMTKR